MEITLRRAAPVLLLAALSAPAFALPEETLSTVVYDMRGVGPELVGEHVDMALLPFAILAQEEREEWEEWAIDADEMAELVRELLVDRIAPDELSFEGRRIDGFGGGLISVVAPAAVHADIERLLTYLRVGFHREAVVSVGLYRVTAGAQLPATLDTNALGVLAQQGQLRLVQQRRETLTVGRTARRGAVVHHQLLRHWEGEVATRSSFLLPKTERLDTGLRTFLRVEDSGTPGAFRLRWAAQVAELTALSRQRVPQQAVVFLEDTMRETTDTGVIDLSTVAYGLLAGSAVMRPGEVRLATFWTETETGQTGYVLRLGLEAARPPQPPLTFGNASLVVTDLSAAEWPLLDPPRIGADTLLVGDSWGRLTRFVEASEFSVLTFPASAPRGGDHPAWLLLEEQTDDDVWQWSREHWAVLTGPRDVVTETLGMLPGSGGESGTVRVEIGVSRPGVQAGSELQAGRLTLDLEHGGAALGIVGDVRSFLQGVELEIAQGSFASPPLLADVMDGLAVRAAADRWGTLTLDVVVNRLLALETVNLRDGSGTYLQIPTQLSDSLHVRLPSDGQRHVIGIVSASEAGVPLELWARASG